MEIDEKARRVIFNHVRYSTIVSEGDKLSLEIKPQAPATEARQSNAKGGLFKKSFRDTWDVANQSASNLRSRFTKN